MVGGGGKQDGCEWRSEAFVKIQKKNFFLGGGREGSRVRGGGRVGGCQCGWERRIEAFVKIKKKDIFFFGGGGSGWGGVGGGGGGRGGGRQVWGSGWM